MGMGFMTWLVVFGNSVRIGTERTITVIHQSATPKSPKQAKNEYCRAVLGTILPTAYGGLIASMSGTLGFRCVADILLINMLTYREFLVTLERFSSVYKEAYENYDPRKIC